MRQRIQTPGCVRPSRNVGKKPSHGLRHTVASDLVQSGAPIHVAQKQLGHASASVTLGIYAHAQRKGLAEAGRALEDYRRRGGG